MEIKSKLQLIAEKASGDTKLKFTSLVHLINKESLDNLLSRMKAGKYQPQAVRHVEIPKLGGSGKRSLGIPAVEAKMVQLAMHEILEAIYEQDFLNCSYGFRPNRSCHQAVNRLDKVIMWQPIFGVSGNIRSLRSIHHHVSRLLYRWVNRRSQKRSMSWEQFSKYLLLNPLPRPKIHYNLYASSRSMWILG